MIFCCAVKGTEDPLKWQITSIYKSLYYQYLAYRCGEYIIWNIFMPPWANIPQI